MLFYSWLIEYPSMICFPFSHDWYYQEDLLSVAQDLLRSIVLSEGHGDQEIIWLLKKLMSGSFLFVFGFSDKQPALYS